MGKGNKKRTPLNERLMLYNQKYGDKRFYLYNIHINQKAVIENQFYLLDLYDICIFQAVKEISGGGFCGRMEDELGVWYNITENLIISYVPIIGITNKTAISNRLVKLEDYKLIERNPKNSPGRKKYLRLGSNAHKLTFCEHK